MVVASPAEGKQKGLAPPLHVRHVPVVRRLEALDAKPPANLVSVHRAQPPVVLVEKGFVQRRRASANLFFQAFVDSLQEDLLDAGSNGALQLLVVVELGYHGRLDRHSQTRNLRARNRWGRRLGHRRRATPRPASNAAPFAGACAAWETTLAASFDALRSARLVVVATVSFLASTLVMAARRHCSRSLGCKRGVRGRAREHESRATSTARTKSSTKSSTYI